MLTKSIEGHRYASHPIGYDSESDRVRIINSITNEFLVLKHLWTRICNSGFAMPKILHQIMPIRGFVPSMISRAMFSIAPRYISCMHHADKNLVSNFDHFVDAGLLPSWWTNPEEAPVGTQGIAGIRWLLRHHRIYKVVMMMFNYFIRWMKWYLRDSKILQKHN